MFDNQLSRRRFLLSSAALGAGAALSMTACSTQRDPGKSFGANEDVRVAIVGFRGRGGDLWREVRTAPGVKVVALCDVDRKVLAKGMSDAEKMGDHVKGYTDIRKILDRNDIDAIVTATPNFWHALATVWACQAGKDVYVEKPASWSIWEGRKMVEAAEKYRRIVQVGMQRRSDKNFYEMIDYIRGGQIGKIIYVLGLCYRDRDSIGKAGGPQPIPPEVDYDLWCGPSVKGPLMRKNLHYDWHWVWETGNGDVGNQGVHEVDQLRWIAGYNTLPKRTFSFGGRFLWDDDGNTPNTQVSVYDYPIPLFHEVRNLKRKAGDTVMDHFKGSRVGVYVCCEGGYYVSGNNGGWVYDNKDQRVKQFTQEGADKHTHNFIAAVRSRKTSDLHAPITEGHLSAALCHMGNVSYRLGEKVSPQTMSDMLRGDRLAGTAWDRIRQHLEANNIDLTREMPTLGASLQFDPSTERFVGMLSDDANKMLKREYRAPFVIPEQV